MYSPHLTRSLPYRPVDVDGLVGNGDVLHDVVKVMKGMDACYSLRDNWKSLKRYRAEGRTSVMKTVKDNCPDECQRFEGQLEGERQRVATYGRSIICEYEANQGLLDGSVHLNVLSRGWLFI